MTTTFLNWKGPQGRETIDEISRASFPTFQAYRLELRRLISEYHLAGMACYSSSRPCALPPVLVRLDDPTESLARSVSRNRPAEYPREEPVSLSDILKGLE